MRKLHPSLPASEHQATELSLLETIKQPDALDAVDAIPSTPRPCRTSTASSSSGSSGIAGVSYPGVAPLWPQPHLFGQVWKNFTALNLTYPMPASVLVCASSPAHIAASLPHGAVGSKQRHPLSGYYPPIECREGATGADCWAVCRWVRLKR